MRDAKSGGGDEQFALVCVWRRSGHPSARKQLLRWRWRTGLARTHRPRGKL